MSSAFALSPAIMCPISFLRGAPQTQPSELSCSREPNSPAQSVEQYQRDQLSESGQTQSRQRKSHSCSRGNLKPRVPLSITIPSRASISTNKVPHSAPALLILAGESVRVRDPSRKPKVQSTERSSHAESENRTSREKTIFKLRAGRGNSCLSDIPEESVIMSKHTPPKRSGARVIPKRHNRCISWSPGNSGYLPVPLKCPMLSVNLITKDKVDSPRFNFATKGYQFTSPSYPPIYDPAYWPLDILQPPDSAGPVCKPSETLTTSLEPGETIPPVTPKSAAIPLCDQLLGTFEASGDEEGLSKCHPHQPVCPSLLHTGNNDAPDGILKSIQKVANFLAPQNLHFQAQVGYSQSATHDIDDSHRQNTDDQVPFGESRLDPDNQVHTTRSRLQESLNVSLLEKLRIPVKAKEIRPHNSDIGSSSIRRSHSPLRRNLRARHHDTTGRGTQKAPLHKRKRRMIGATIYSQCSLKRSQDGPVRLSLGAQVHISQMEANKQLEEKQITTVLENIMVQKAINPRIDTNNHTEEIQPDFQATRLISVVGASETQETPNPGSGIEPKILELKDDRDSGARSATIGLIQTTNEGLKPPVDPNNGIESGTPSKRLPAIEAPPTISEDFKPPEKRKKHSRILTGQFSGLLLVDKPFEPEIIDKRFGCPICKTHFGLRKHFNRHAKMHTGEGKHVCDSCNGRWVRKDQYLRHLQHCSGGQAQDYPTKKRQRI